ncbi:MAG: HaeIII family restriction endonuclease [Clostridia bacterium]
MSNQSNVFGRAYEYICIETLNSEINKYRKAAIEESSTYEVAKECWNIVDKETKDIFKQSALTATFSIFELEPMITEKGEDCLVLKMQKDSEGEIGDVRDIIIIRNAEKWEIGLSIKHNHFAVKHSRLGPKLDFGERWYGIKCSDEYWNEIIPIFDFINSKKELKLKWSDLENKERDVYIPLLNAFMKEIKRNTDKHPELPKKLVEYLLGEFDFYKVISIDSKKITQIQTYNLRGTLNKPSKKEKPKTIIPIAKLPTRIVNIDFKPESKNTIELYMNEGWQFSFRIHNASTYVENSLKFDIQIVGMPTSIISIDCKWTGC